MVRATRVKAKKSKSRSKPVKRIKSTIGDAKRIARVIAGLESLYPDAHCELDFKTPFQLVVATILSAQCTDKRVNMVTPILFARFPDAAAMAQADRAELESIIKST